MAELIKYEFWKEERKWYRECFSKVFKNDLNSIKKEIANRILQTTLRELNWLDIGTGDGSTLIKILKKIDQIEDFKIKITVIEPSRYAIVLLKEKLNRIKNVNYKIIDSKLNFRLLEDKYDCIVICHANYYLASNKEEFKELYQKLYEHLNKKGVLIVQTIANNSDFQILGNPKYSKFALGHKTLEIFKEIFKNVQFKEIPTRVNITKYLKQNLTPKIREELLHFYRFVTQKQRATLTESKLNDFISKIKKLAKSDKERNFLDFKDCIISVQKI